ncbi:MAG: hypothetical protein R2853_01815 [Thermomicrobiales bacterium]
MCDGVSPGWLRDVAAGNAFGPAAITANIIRSTQAHVSYNSVEASGQEGLHVAVFADDLLCATQVEVATVVPLDAAIRCLAPSIVAMRNSAEARAANAPVNRQEIADLAASAPRPLRLTP